MREEALDATDVGALHELHRDVTCARPQFSVGVAVEYSARVPGGPHIDGAVRGGVERDPALDELSASVTEELGMLCWRCALGRPGKSAMQGMQGHGSAVNERGPNLRKAPASIHLSDLGRLAEYPQHGIAFGSVREELTDALLSYPTTSKAVVDSEFLDNDGSRWRECRVSGWRHFGESSLPGTVLVKPLR